MQLTGYLRTMAKSDECSAHGDQSNGMHTRVITLRDLALPDEEAWRDLAQRSVEPNPFYEADFLVPASRHLRNGKKAQLLVAEAAGRFHACLPVRSIGLRMIVSPLVITSWRHLYGYLGTPLVAPERAVEALSCILTTLRGGVSPRVVVLELFGDDGPAAFYLRCAAGELGLAVHAHESGERAALRGPSEKADRPSASARRARRAKAQQWRRLCTDWGDPTVIDHAADTDGPARFLAIEASGWKGKAGTALASRRGDAAFYREVTARFGASGRLCLYSLEAEGKTLAMQTSLRAGSTLFDWKVGYDERFARYGPGAQLQLRVPDKVWGDGVRCIDTCSDVGDNHQFRLFPDRRRIATLIVHRDGRMKRPVLTLAVLTVKISGKLRVLSHRTFGYSIAKSSRAIIRKALRR